MNRAPLSFAQERLWFLEQLEPGNAVYNICRAARLKGALNVAALELSFREILGRHESLRTKFIAIDGRPLQVVTAEVILNIRTIELQQSPETKRDREIKQLITEEARRSFDLAQAPLLRVTLLRLADVDHILIIATHHIVSDAWSMGILSRELWTLYEAHTRGRPAHLPKLQVQYADYAAWQREWLQGEVLESQLSYWKQRLENAPPMIDLPTDRCRPARQRFRGRSVPIALSESLTEAVNELSHREGVTQYMTLLAAFNVLLFRYSGQEDIIIGSPIANRHHWEVETLIGYFANTFVLRTDLSGNPSFREVVRRVRDVCLAAYAHQDLPFEKLVTELHPERTLSRNPLFQVMFILQNAPRRAIDPSQIKIDSIALDSGTSKVDLTLALRERNGRLIGFIEYSTDLFNRSTIERMAGHFRTLLQEIVANSEEPISNLAILTNAERNRILLKWNNTGVNYPKSKFIHELFEEQVERTPNAVALTFDRQHLTYRELNIQANQLAHYLRELGVEGEELVGVCIERSLEMVVALLAILKAGGAYFPLDPDYPQERLRLMLEDARVPVVVTLEKFLEVCSQSSLSPKPICVCLDRDRAVVAQESEVNPWIDRRTEKLAYVIYTSGSSGQPKGVKVNHHSVVNLFYATSLKLEFGETDCWTLFHSYSFDFSVWEMWGCLLSGGRLVVVPLQLTRSPAGFLKLLRRERVTVLNQTPTAISQLVERMSADSDLEDLSLRQIICGGEILSPMLASSLLAWGIPLWNFYGPTEATVWSAVHEVTSVDRLKPLIPIGRPLANTQIYVLDRALQPVPIGVRGEIYVGGEGLAREYLNRPELTAERFVDNPLKKGKRIYRTGDFGRYRSDGSIDCVGRADNQVKIRGHRVELGEIEANLRQHSAIEDAVVVLADEPAVKDVRTKSPELVIAHSSPLQRLIAYVVPATQNLSVSELRNFLKEKLPEYMIPSAFLFLRSLPVFPNGKIDRRALMQAEDFRPNIECVRVEPRTPIEEMVAEIWKDVLKLDSITVNDNFFELGGHSLLAIQIISRLRDKFAKDVSIHAMFEMPTIAELASSLENTDDHSSRYLPPISRVPRNQPLPLSMNQEQLWHLEQIIPGTHFFNVPYVYRLNGDLNIIDLEKALQEVIKRHEALRTVFSLENGRPFQIIKETFDFCLPVIDLRSAASDAASERAADIMMQERTQSFDLVHGPLIKTKLLCLTNSEYLLLVTMHHIVTDEWSMRVFFKELTTHYGAYFQGLEPASSLPAIQHADFAHWERELLNRGLFQEQLNYWTKQLTGRISQLKFKKARQRTKPKSFRTRRILLEFPKDLCPAVRQVAKAENATPFVILLAALNILLYRSTGQRDIRVGTLMANRSRKETEQVIGHFMNTVVLRNRVTPQLTFRQFVKQVGDGLRSALTNQELPFHHLARVLKQERGIPGGALVPVLFIYHKRALDIVRLPGTTFAPVGWQYPSADANVMITTCDLVINMWEMKTRIVGTMNYNPDEFGNEVVTDMATRLTTILERMMADIEDSIHS